MACLNKLAIRGIRSFDDKQISVIEFFSPVTVIVGHNGSGKTTIIECLKYATTGDQPPNTKGGAFVHDPKIANEKEVKAQVKLRFHAANGTRMLAVRNLSVTVKKTAGLTMKTLESILALADSNPEKSGKRGVISTKCAEMDAEIPQLLGVSKAVLENVIFCHQEDSYWPLAEPSILKKKFDDIFEATRYTKALNSIKDLRKERVAELKAEKERLISLSREKQHFDKLKGRIKDANAGIAAKEVEYDNAKEEYDRVAEENRKFYEYNSKFREIYKEVENLEKLKSRSRQDLEDAKDGNFQEIAGTDEELALRMSQFNQHIETQRQSLLREERKKQDIEDDVIRSRDQHTELLAMKGRLAAEAEAQARRIADRENMIREIGKTHNIAVPAQTLERDQVVAFISQITEIQRRQKTEFERLQADLITKTDEYHAKVRKLENESQTFKAQRQNLREQLQERQNSIRTSDRMLEGQSSVEIALRSTQDDIKEKKERIDRIKTDLENAGYEEKVQKLVEQARGLEEKRDSLLEESRSLSMQADSRAKLDLKRAEIKSKKSEIQTTQRAIAFKYEELTGRQLNPETVEVEIDSLMLSEEAEKEELEHDQSSATAELRTAEASIASCKAEIHAREQEARDIQNRVQAILDESEFGFGTIKEAIVESTAELDALKNKQNNSAGSIETYQSILKTGKQEKRCLGCNRGLKDGELKEFEQHVKATMDGLIKEDPKVLQADIQGWQTWLKTFGEYTTDEDNRSKIIETLIPESKAKLLADKLDELKQLIKSISALKQQTGTIARLKKEIERTEGEVGDLETELSLTGSTRTVDDVQAELNDITSELRAIEKDRQSLTNEKDRQQTALRTFESKAHQLELEEQRSLNKLNELKSLSERLEQMKNDVASFTLQIKELDGKIAEAQAPIQSLDDAHKQLQETVNGRINLAQTRLQELSMSIDRLGAMNKNIERYVKERKARDLEECQTKIKECEQELKETDDRLEACRGSIKTIEREISESGASNTNLRENIRVRKLQKDILDIQAQIDTYDVEEAARARRNFNAQWEQRKEEENQLNTTYNHLAGELSSMQAQVKSLEGDLKEFKDINKNYTQQLVKVKISDMANNDLEKYAKALDNAIMKYHGLKMEEVNDTMKHLWNKTYQGTDIDGIKIRSDVEGGASKRSYNYRVVMTKDQVEMDMRGRCSAGQKMLASIIIRLALSDSFGQNCGILALDEPTNALDTENIDALAESLVDIINERKSHSNFQLIIITHDENFLRKLGQSDVMEYYWRISRDARQKSVIERQRFR